jgi:N-acetylmuramoyl-L-alanine amidase
MFRICLDPGHGGKDRWNRGPTGYVEADGVLDIALECGKPLKENGLDVIYTRTSDVNLTWTNKYLRDLPARAQFANQHKANFFVSIHTNAGSKFSGGIETFCYKRGGKGECLAQSIQKALVEALGLQDRGVKEANFAVLRETDMPAVLIEVAFHSNPEEEALLKDPAFRKKAAEAIAKGIINYLGIQPKKGESGMFLDVEKKKWYAGVVEEAARLGLMAGTGNGKFSPDQPMTRAELAAVAVRLYKATNEDFVEVIHKVLPSVVQVENFELGGLGSGTIIREDGLVLTNAHVVMGEKEIRDSKGNVIDKIKTQAKTVGFRTTELPWSYAEGPVLSVDEKYDLALCQIELKEKFPALPFGKFESVKKAQKVMAIGSPLGMIGSVTEGVVSAIREDLRTSGDIYIQTEAEINPGNSGGTLVNLDGELIGVPSCKLSGVGIEGLNFAIGLPTVERFLKQYEVL